MCGFVGLWQRDESVSESVLVRMRDALQHRGPDDAGLVLNRRGNVGMGFRRLSIIDLSPAGHQPMTARDGALMSVFNGELVNYRNLRETLAQAGWPFRSHSDSEVAMAAFATHGPAALTDFRGMYAMAFWDDSQNRLTLIRDRLGIKPLYYYWDGQRFLFASELKALVAHPAFRRRIDTEALQDYWTYGYVPHDRAIYQNTYKLPAGHRLTFAAGKVQVTPYWQPTYRPTTHKADELAQATRERIREATRTWMVSDVPVGLFLSGGLDSSTLCAAMHQDRQQRINSYAIAFDHEGKNELPYARTVAETFGTQHRERTVTWGDAARLLPALAEVYDEPFYDSSAIPTLFVAAFAAQHQRVVLGGDGGDELFFGYGWHAAAMHHQQNPPAWRSLGRLADRFMPQSARHLPGLARWPSMRAALTDDPAERHFRLIGFFDDWEQQQLFGLANKQRDPLWLFRKFYAADLPPATGLRLLDLQTYLVDDILTKVDRAGMAFSLEVRPPLLDHKLVEWVLTVPDEAIYANHNLKALLKASQRGILPDAIIDRNKRGFSAPIRHWLRGDLESMVASYLLTGRAVADGLIRPRAVQAMLRNRTFNRWAKLWQLLVFESWYRRWIHGENLTDLPLQLLN